MHKLIAYVLLTFTVLSLPVMAATPNDDVLAAIRNYRQALVKKDLAALDSIWSAATGNCSLRQIGSRS